MKVSKYYLKAQAKDIPAETKVMKETPDPRSRQRLLTYTLTNKISYYSDDNTEIIQYAKKMLYLIDNKGKISFIAPENYVSVGFDTLEEIKEFVSKLK